ncbi:myelin protein zero-like protein 1 isoform X2 [Ambystoma mexicanum]|uniref:myelin protein zero-like protein 1 isoform X2 n=1 Tax=Ambystoma mexicanum TaxID=8296 RepID=UPI0037E97F1C
MAVGSSFATRWRLLAVVCLSLGFALQVDAVDVYTPSELFVENGTKARLPCTFKSSEVVSSKASVSWNYMGDGKNPSAILYYLSGQSYPGSDPLFKDRVTWAGDFNKKDASIYIENVQFRDNGTYTCDVKNPPDIAGLPGTIVLRVVAKEHLPVFTPGVVAGIAIGSVAAFLLLVALIVFVVCMTVNSEKDYSGARSYMHN